MAVTEVNYFNNNAFSETVLWENSNPNTDFAGSTTNQIPLTNGKFSDYKYIRIDYKSNTSTSSDDFVSITIDINSWTKMTANVMWNMSGVSGSYVYARYIRYTSDTSLVISPVYPLNISGSTAGSPNNLFIPLRIVGLN